MAIAKIPSFLIFTITIMLVCLCALALAETASVGITVYTTGTTTAPAQLSHGNAYKLSFRYDTPTLPDETTLSFTYKEFITSRSVTKVFSSDAFTITYTASESGDNYFIEIRLPYNATSLPASDASFFSVSIPSLDVPASPTVLTSSNFPLIAYYWYTPSFPPCGTALQCSETTVNRSISCMVQYASYGVSVVETFCAVAGVKPDTVATCPITTQCVNGATCLSSLCVCPNGLSGAKCDNVVSFALNTTDDHLIVNEFYELSWDIGTEDASSLSLYYCPWANSCTQIINPSRKLTSTDSLVFKMEYGKVYASTAFSFQLRTGQTVLYKYASNVVEYSWTTLGGECRAACGTYTMSRSVKCMRYESSSQYPIFEESLCEKFTTNPKPAAFYECNDDGDDECANGSTCNNDKLECVCKDTFFGSFCEKTTKPPITAVILSKSGSTTKLYAANIGDAYTISISVDPVAAATFKCNFVSFTLSSQNGNSFKLNTDYVPVEGTTVTLSTRLTNYYVSASQSAFIKVRCYETNTASEWQPTYVAESDIFSLTKYEWNTSDFSPACTQICGTIEQKRTLYCQKNDGRETGYTVVSDNECTADRTPAYTGQLTNQCVADVDSCMNSGSCTDNKCVCATNWAGDYCGVPSSDAPTTFSGLSAQNASSTFGVVQGQWYTLSWTFLPKVGAKAPYDSTAVANLYISSVDADEQELLQRDVKLIGGTVTVAIPTGLAPSKTAVFSLKFTDSSLTIRSTLTTLSNPVYWLSTNWSDCYSAYFQCEVKTSRAVVCRQPLPGSDDDKTVADSVCAKLEKPLTTDICSNTYDICNNGVCGDKHQCVCSPGWSGEQCNVPSCGLCEVSHTTSCSNTTATPGVCNCKQGWTGPTCAIATTCNTNTTNACQNSGYYAYNDDSSCLSTACRCDYPFSGIHCEKCQNECGDHGKRSADCKSCVCDSKGYYGENCNCRRAFITLNFTNAPSAVFPSYSNSAWTNFTSVQIDNQASYDSILRSIFSDISGIDMSKFIMYQWSTKRDTHNLTITWGVGTDCYPFYNDFVLQSVIDAKLSAASPLPVQGKFATMGMELLAEANNMVSVYAAINQITSVLSQPNNQYMSSIASESITAAPVMTTTPANAVYDEECVGDNADKAICPTIIINPFVPEKEGNNSAFTQTGGVVICFTAMVIAILF